MSGIQRFRVGLVTSADEATLTADDRSTLPFFDQVGIDAEPIIWSDHLHDPRQFDALIVRSAWDYHIRYPEFLSWLDDVEHAEITLWNEPDTIRWNSNKLYLLELRDGGVTIPRTAAITHPQQEIPRDLMNTAVVLKPTVSADSFRTVHVNSRHDADIQSALGHILSHSPALVQEFMPEIVSEGEYSFIFIDGGYSHCVLKRPADGDFRVQEELGGTCSPITPSAALIDQARSVIGLLDPKPLYARVDGIRKDSTLVVMELELIEPSLYLLHSPSAAERFALACRKRLDDHA